MRTLHAQAIINAPADRVWAIVADLRSYPQWNPFIVGASGQVRVGGRLNVTIVAPSMKPVHFRPRILNYQPGRLIRWKGSLWIGGLFDGRHALVVEPINDSLTRFTSHEEVTGILVPFLGKAMRASQQGFEEMCKALKARAEAASATP